MSHLEESNALQNWATGHWKAMLWQEHQQGVTIEAVSLLQLPFARLLLVEWLLPFGFHPDQCVQMLQAAPATSFESELWTLYKSAETFELRQRLTPDAASLEIPIQEGVFPTPEGPSLEIRWLDHCASTLPKDLNQCLIDKAWLQDAKTLTLHHWEEGDRIQPLGMKGRHQKIHDVLTNAKVPAYAKSIRILRIRGQIVWVPGLKRSIHGTLHPDTSEVLSLTWHTDQ
jgi:tRNA(Ile)-lysidine synthetase-like protein